MRAVGGAQMERLLESKAGAWGGGGGWPRRPGGTVANSGWGRDGEWRGPAASMLLTDRRALL